MICNELYDGQGLGNQLWNYAVARVLADRLGCQFSILGREKFKGKQFMPLDFGVPLTGGSSPEGGPPTKLPEGILHYYRERRENFRGTGTDISRTDPGLLAIQPQTKFDGNCQSTTYLEGYQAKIREWITIRPTSDSQTTDDDTCMIHLRCGDFAGLKDVFLPFSYYQQAMEHVRKLHPGIRFTCVTDQPEVAKTILPDVEIVGASLVGKTDTEKASHHLGGPIGIDFGLLVQAKYLIIPNSSFSWWAAYLNTRAVAIVAPKYWASYNVSDGYWSTSDMITEGFTYLDRSGMAFSPAQCQTEKEAFEAVHQDIFAQPAPSITTPSLLQKIKSKLFHLYHSTT